MSLEHILLGMLQRPASGYDLRSEFENGARFFWSAELSQIYPTLKRMEKRGWLDSRIEPSPKGPDRRVYERTAVGQDELRDWLLSGPAMGAERFAYIGQLIFMGELNDLNATLEFLMELREELSAIKRQLGSTRSDVPGMLPYGESLAAQPNVTSSETNFVTKTSSAKLSSAKYSLPEIDLLEADEQPSGSLDQELKSRALELEKFFHGFGLGVKVADVAAVGPVVSQFQIEPEAGVRVAKIQALADDLAIAMQVPAVRIVTASSGKSSVAIEIPNEKPALVRLQGLIDLASAGENPAVPLFLGRDVAGDPLTVDLAQLPHLLIAGRSGSGKTVCLDSIIASILMTRSPDQVRLLLIDSGTVEFSRYQDLPHLLQPILTDMTLAATAFAWAVNEMERRYELLKAKRVRNVNAYNDCFDGDVDAEQDRLPAIVIMVDELAELMQTSGSEIEQSVIRLAQKGRNVGIHVVLATQKPTVDVITGLIKSNIPSRISFQVASRTDSRVVLEESGAEKLLGNGDMLFRQAGQAILSRVQGTLLAEDELDRITAATCNGEQNFSSDLNSFLQNANTAPLDELYDRAVEVVVTEQRGSVSLLQRSLGIGYGRSARLLDVMTEHGIVGGYSGSKSRAVLMTVQQWKASRNSSTDCQTAHTTNAADSELARADVDLATFHNHLSVQMGLMSLTTKLAWCDQAISVVQTRMNREREPVSG